MIHVEMNHDARIIRLGGEHAPAQVRPWMGDSIGHWEDDALVVETTNFHPGQTFRAAVKHQLLLSPEGVVTERLRRVGEAEIKYSFEVQDPALYSEPWRGEISLRPADGRIYEYACHEGNYALPWHPRRSPPRGSGSGRRPIVSCPHAARRHLEHEHERTKSSQPPPAAVRSCPPACHPHRRPGQPHGR